MDHVWCTKNPGEFDACLGTLGVPDLGIIVLGSPSGMQINDQIR